jgi:hypothetical protein
MGYRVVAVAVVAVHFAYLGYVIVGGFLAWRWPRTVWVHLPAVGWGVALIALGLDCPLTHAQDWARQRAGQPALTGGFIDQYVEDALYPQRFTPVVQAVVAGLVIGSWIGLTVVRRPPRPARSRSRFRTR